MEINRGRVVKMTGTYQWKPAVSWPGTVDPYTRWLVDTAPNCLDVERFTQCRNNHWFLILLKSSEKNAPCDSDSGSLRQFDNDNIIWEPEGSEFAYLLSRNSFGNLAKDLNKPVGAKKSKRDAKSAGASSKLTSDEIYAQLAPLDDAMIPIDVAEPTVGDMDALGVDPEKAVILGIIDDGINIAHERFIDPKGNPRIDFAWIQDGVLNEESPIPPTILFGKEISADQIRDARAHSDTEEKTLRALGLVNPSRTEATTLSKAFSHGTFVLDVLAGYSTDQKHYRGPGTGRPEPSTENDENCAKDRRIVAVQLNRRVTEESSGALYALFAILGLQYIVDRARRIAKELRKPKGRKIPLIVNFSYGLSGGPHNGDHIFERFVEEMIANLDKDPDLGPLLVPMPVGNRYLLKGHAHVEATQACERELKLNWTTQPQDKSPNYLEVWIPKANEPKKKRAGAKQSVTLSLKPPFGDRDAVLEETFDVGTLTGKEDKDLHDASGNIVARVSFDVLDASNAPTKMRSTAKDKYYPKLRMLIALAPTRSVSDDTASIPPGTWDVSVKCYLESGEFIEAWIQRDDSPPFFGRPGRQSYLEDLSWTLDDQRRDELNEYVDEHDENAGLSRYGTINGLATSNGMIRVSGHRLSDGSRAVYSGEPHDGMLDTEISAICDRSRVVSGLVGTGGRSGSGQIMNGTSVSAPAVGRDIADYLSKNDHSTSKEAKEAYLKTVCSSTTGEGIPRISRASRKA